MLSHPSLTGLNSGSGTSGSTAWNNSVRSRLYLTREIDSQGFEADPDKRVLTTKKANYGRVGGEITVRWHNGVFEAAAAPSPADAAEASSKALRVFLKTP
jgi:RecA-family ATPase